MKRRPPSSTPFPYTPLFRSPQTGAGQEPAGALGTRRPPASAGGPAEECRGDADGQHGQPGDDDGEHVGRMTHRTRAAAVPRREDRKSTRLNSSHANISYAVF